MIASPTVHRRNFGGFRARPGLGSVTDTPPGGAALLEGAEGFTRLTMDQVAATLNCSKRTLYALAASKEQLAVLAVRHFFKRSTEQVEAAITATRNPARRVTHRGGSRSCRRPLRR